MVISQYHHWCWCAHWTSRFNPQILPHHRRQYQYLHLKRQQALHCCADPINCHHALRIKSKKAERAQRANRECQKRSTIKVFVSEITDHKA